jgi:hypothetical protein
MKDMNMGSSPSAYSGGNRLASSIAKKFKPRASVGINVETHTRVPGEPRNDWRKEERDRLVSEIKAIERELASFNPEKTAERVKKALGIKLQLKKLRHQEHVMKMESVTDLD